MEYLKPVNFYQQFFKDILKKEDYLKPGRLLGLDVSDKYVSLAVSDWKNKTAVPLSYEPERGSIDSGGQPNCGSVDRSDGKPFCGSNEYHGGEFVCL
ncbi:hypothetical protein LWI29_037937 [Acer saccharum]|uniref:Uncharacterized protein n=1 Tax=Acer saccharum TaxID=4024 RepID=A0AA39RWK6_ACESA|nr:hypothetical protein LWI29_037937 [Acer saccharum]